MKCSYPSERAQADLARLTLNDSTFPLQEYISDPDEELRRAQLLDSVLLFALVNCAPSRRNATVQLLSSPNFCQVETCSVLLASQGNPYTEALLWLYRSHNLHSRVLDALKEEKSVAPGEFYTSY